MGLYLNQYSKFDQFFPSLDKENFISRIIKKSENECWEFKTLRASKTYKFFWVPELKINILAHRFSFWIHNGSIDSSLVVDHECQNKNCINPKHLRNVSLKVNATENSTNALALNKAKTHCKNGHLFNDENTTIRASGGRRCRLCHSNSEAKRRAKKGGLNGV